MQTRIMVILLCAGAMLFSAETVLIPRVESRWIKDDVLTIQPSKPWSDGAVFHGFLQLGTNKDAVKDTQARLFHDGQKLYFAFFRTVESNSLCNSLKRDDAIWADDSIGLLIAPDAANPQAFYQIVINSQGGIYDEERFPDNTFNFSKNFNSLQIHIFPGERAWLLYGSIDLAELSIIPDRKFALNLTSHRRESDGSEEYSTWAPLSRPSFLTPESFVAASLGPVQTPPAEYTYAERPELCLDGEGEMGICDRWIRRNGAGISKWHKASGSNSLSVICKPGYEMSNYFHKLQLQPATRYMLSFVGRYGTLETPNLVPIRIHCLDANGKTVAILDGPGLGNLGGGVPNYRFDAYKKDFMTPAETVNGELEIRVAGTGSINLDAISVRKYVPITHIPTPKSPADGSVVNSNRIEFLWKLFTREDLRPGTLTIECSRNSEFSQEETLVFSECALDPAAGTWKETLPSQGQWYWRIRFDGEDGGVWSKPCAFRIEYDARNEKIAPVIDGMSPRGKMTTKPTQIRIAYTDPEISSGIGKVLLKINRQDVTSNASIEPNGIVFSLPDDGKEFYEIECEVFDANGNRAEENDFIAIGPGKGEIKVDAGGFLAVDGERIFPVSAYAYMDPAQFPAMRNFGYNCNMTPWVTPPNPTLWKLLGDATRAGIVTIPITLPDYLWGKGYIKTNTRAAQRFLEKEMKYAAKLVGHPGVIGFYVGDESIDAGYRMDVYQEFYRLLKKAAPEIPVTWLPTYGQTNRFAWEGSVLACDMLIHDDYVSQRNQHLLMFPDIDRITEWTKGLPFIEILGAHSPTSDWDKPVQRFPTYEDMRYCAWASIVAGSKGMAVYHQGKYKSLITNPFEGTNAPDFQDRLARVLKEINEAVPFLLADKTPEKAHHTVVSGSARVLEREFNGTVLSIIVNAGEDPCEINFADGNAMSIKRLGVVLHRQTVRP